MPHAKPRRTVDNILNQPKKNWSILLMGFGLSLMAFLFVSRFWGVVLLPVVLGLSAWVTRNDRRMWLLIVLSLGQGSSYDPRK